MRRHLLRVIERAAIGEIGGDARRAKTMVADRRHDADGGGAAADHAPSVAITALCAVTISVFLLKPSRGSVFLMLGSLPVLMTLPVGYLLCR